MSIGKTNEMNGFYKKEA